MINDCAYENAFWNANIPLDKLRELDNLPKYVYKYVRFDEHEHWKNYIEGNYHLSRPRIFFDDPSDCKPTIKISSVLEELECIRLHYPCIDVSDKLDVLNALLGKGKDIIGDSLKSVMLKILNTQFNRIQDNFKWASLKTHKIFHFQW